MTATRDLLTGLQALLAATTTVPGYVSALPYEVDRAWSVAYTNAATDPEGRWGQGILMLQSRGAPGIPLDADDIADPLVATLMGLTGTVLGSTAVTQCLHGLSSRGLDSSRRSVRADRFDLYLDYPA